MATIYYDPNKDNLVPRKKPEKKEKRLNIFQRIVYGDDAFSFWGQIVLYILVILGVIALTVICAIGWLFGLTNGWWLFWLILWVVGGILAMVTIIWIAQPDYVIYQF